MTSLLLLYFFYSGLGLLIYSKLSTVELKDNLAKALGESFLIGVLGVVFICNFIQLLGINIPPLYLVIVFSMVAMIPYVLLFKSIHREKLKSLNLKPRSNWEYIAWALVLLHMYLIISQSHLLPLTPWDAWYGWIAKAKIWVFHGLNEPLLNRTDWLVSEVNFTNPTAHYPDGLPLLYYINSGFFGWNEPLLNSIYPCLFISLLLMIYGNIVSLTKSVFYAWMSVLFILTLPFINIHVTLGGYADILVACILFLLVISSQRFLDNKNTIHLIAVIFYSFGLIMFKLESWVWLIGLYLVMFFALISKRNKTIFTFILIVSSILWIIMGGITITTPIGEIALQPHLIQIPMLGSYELSFSNTSIAWMESLFLSHNWNLLWFSVPFAIYFALRLKDKSQIILPATYLIFAASFLFVLFYMTSASVWANDFTSSNRIVLHIVPIYVYFIVRVFEQWQKQKSL